MPADASAAGHFCAAARWDVGACRMRDARPSRVGGCARAGRILMFKRYARVDPIAGIYLLSPPKSWLRKQGNAYALSD